MATIRVPTGISTALGVASATWVPEIVLNREVFFLLRILTRYWAGVLEITM